MRLRKSNTKWIEIKDFEGVEFKIDYPTNEQMEELREVFFQIIFNNPNYSQDKDAKEIELSFEQKAKEKRLLEKVAKLNIKYCVKDWKGIEDSEGKTVECKVINNELDKELFEMLLANFEYTHLIRIGNMIEDEIRFNEIDKKK